jgi:hypothetical protein
MSRKRHRCDFSRTIPPVDDDCDAEDIPPKYRLFGRNQRADPLPTICDAEVQEHSGTSFKYRYLAPLCRRRTTDTEWLLTHLYENHGYCRHDVDTVYRKHFQDGSHRPPNSFRPHDRHAQQLNRTAYTAVYTDHHHRPPVLAIGPILITVLCTGCIPEVTVTRPPPSSPTVPTAWTTAAVIANTPRHHPAVSRRRQCHVTIRTTYR